MFSNVKYEIFSVLSRVSNLNWYFRTAYYKQKNSDWDELNLFVNFRNIEYHNIFCISRVFCINLHIVKIDGLKTLIKELKFTTIKDWYKFTWNQLIKSFQEWVYLIFDACIELEVWCLLNKFFLVFICNYNVSSFGIRSCTTGFPKKSIVSLKDWCRISESLLSSHLRLVK